MDYDKISNDIKKFFVNLALIIFNAMAIIGFISWIDHDHDRDR